MASSGSLSGRFRGFRLPVWEVWLAVYGLILLAWIGIAAMSMQWQPDGSVPAEFWAMLCSPAAAISPFSLWAMWGLMSVAMMLPGFLPVLSTHSDLRRAGAGSGGEAAGLVAGYLAVWLGASAFGAATQYGLSRLGLVSPLGQSLSPWLNAGLLIAAGLYQFSALKAACLTRCRMPLTVFMSHWRPGPAAGFALGLRFGAHCLGCCWALMLLGLVGGVMSLGWMGAATLFMAFEKLPAIGRRLTAPAGLLLIVAGGVAALSALHLV
ncbi:putative metal-binding membrane protein [Albidovulum inexpectatum]|uniref:Putative metal-binding membrane protein n=1 Tax=Albidovulum inexpectatum TaxID=196587 RepID=A0A2S5JEX8_9RHOB|nr:DUF2182 domain-containing protein [Albidovulum inexpectatum]PPB80076.1 putative metal-binding membrane protein [Albidovulum inexpectatum]